jgi:phenylacetate-CoA ligase
MDAGQMLKVSMLLAQMRANQWKSTEELEEMQGRRLLDLVSYASKHVPHYRKSFSGLRMRDIDDFHSLPIVKKDAIRGDPELFLSDRFDKSRHIRMSTSGSSGFPLSVFHSPAESAYGPAFEMHQMIEAGVGPFDIHAVITRERPAPSPLNALGLFRRHPVEFRNARQAAADIVAIRPTVIRGTPSFLIPIAHENLVSGLGLKTRRAFTFSEILHKKGRELIERSLGCAVFDSYGSIETSWISWECAKGGLHIYSDQLFAEVVDERGNPVPHGQEGNLVLTPLWQRAMPFIRYNLGDRTALGGKCKCGRGYHTINPVEGRNNDYLVLPSGALCSAHMISFNIRSYPGILQFQARQEKSGELVILIVPDGSMAQDGKLAIFKILSSALPEAMDIRVELVDVIPRAPSGKLCDFVSSINPKI